ncbi:MAG: hypothetical protein V3V15_02300 [Sphingorhabdus sp.]
MDEISKAVIAMIGGAIVIVGALMLFGVETPQVGKATEAPTQNVATPAPPNKSSGETPDAAEPKSTGREVDDLDGFGDPIFAAKPTDEFAAAQDKPSELDQSVATIAEPAEDADETENDDTASSDTAANDDGATSTIADFANN